MDAAEIMTAVGWTAGTLLVLAAALGIAMVWYRRQRSATLSSHQLLAEFRAMMAQGEMSAEEFKRVQAVLRTRLGGELGRDHERPGLPQGPQTPAQEPTTE